ncbi:class I SAM-dependent methyltransferase [Thalassobaculum salexigens]|uniref:class I SAM-dependent methyltransferase n=1 Tax=Thalassobaculum salexigens TaxID=455360 RepID=UPI0003FB1B50|nr:methyltransferase domain-containing protein [Thalassobaculum salexigens]
MFNDAVDLRDFYDSPLGHLARRMIRRQVRGLWSDLRGQSLLGLGFATPYLRPFRGEAERVLSFMPAQQGVLHWPPEGPNLSALVDEGELPLEDASVDRIIVVHALEGTEQRAAMMSELWRVLAANGRILFVVPNRRGLWARFDHTPFGHGQPYTVGQLSRMLRDSRFTPTRTVNSVYTPPYVSGLLIRSAPAIERIGDRWFNTFAGVVMIEAQKQVYAIRRDRKRVLARARDLIASPRPTPAPAPRSLYLELACPTTFTDRLPKTNQTPGGDPACTLSP